MLGIGDDKSLKVLIVGNDNLLRTGWVNKNEGLAFGKYIINADAIFLTEDKGWFFSKNVPTIAFYENDPNPIMRKEIVYKYSTEELGDAVSMAAWALAKLLVAKKEQFETLVMYLLIGCIILSAGSVFLGYNNGKKLDEIKSAVIASQPVSPDIVNPTPTLPSGGGTVAPTPAPTGNLVPLPMPSPPPG